MDDNTGKRMLEQDFTEYMTSETHENNVAIFRKKIPYLSKKFATWAAPLSLFSPAKDPMSKS